MNNNPPPPPKTKYRQIKVTSQSFIDEVNRVRLIERAQEEKERKDRENKPVVAKKGWCGIL